MQKTSHLGNKLPMQTIRHLHLETLPAHTQTKHIGHTTMAWRHHRTHGCVNVHRSHAHALKTRVEEKTRARHDTFATFEMQWQISKSDLKTKYARSNT